MYILPTPAHMELTQEQFILSYQAYLVVNPVCGKKIYRQAVILQEKIKEATGYDLHITYGEARKGDIYLTCLEREAEHCDEYELTVTADQITLKGTEESLIWAIQTLGQVIKQTGASVPGMAVRDFAQLQYRGFYHDVTRGRVPTLSFMKWLADKLSEYKINQLQLYIENTHLFRDFSEVWRDDDPLTTEEILELDDYCYERGIELVPSISTISHLYEVLRTKQYSELCELEGADEEPFVAWDKQMHHILDITNEKSYPFVEKMLDEYRPLFRTKKFNMCADEPFDLGTGRSKEYCDKIGKDQAYIEFVKKLCTHLLELGCEPMMWGDIIGKYPELVNELPKEMTFLNWGYAADVKEDESRQFGEAKAVFYNCPGVSSWSKLIPDNKVGYQNIRRMAEYGQKYGAVGLLNTDWGDFHHMSNPEFSIPGMVYGAQFSWSSNTLEYDELNRQISVLEFGKDCTEVGKWIGDIQDHLVYSSMNICMFREYQTYYKEKNNSYIKEYVETYFDKPELSEKVPSANEALKAIQKELIAQVPNASAYGKERLLPYIVTLDGCICFNEVGAMVAKSAYQKKEIEKAEAFALAKKLEEWLYYYKKLWRKVSKESELFRITEVVSWYADYLRTL